jgi:multisubunit Na+/H+ antiporter MnhB subunit
MNEDSINDIKTNGFGFLASGIVWGVLAGAMLAYYPEFSRGAFEFPNEKLYDYCIYCVVTSTAVGFSAGLIIDLTVRNNDARQAILKKSWMLFAFCLVAFVVSANALRRVY